MKLNNLEKLVIGIITFVVLAFLSALVFLPPYFEMKAFNKFSKTKATYIDALFTNLRVIPD